MEMKRERDRSGPFDEDIAFGVRKKHRKYHILRTLKSNSTLLTGVVKLPSSKLLTYPSFLTKLLPYPYLYIFFFE